MAKAYIYLYRTRVTIFFSCNLTILKKEIIQHIYTLIEVFLKKMIEVLKIFV